MLHVYQQGFQRDFFGTALKLTGKTWLKMTIAYVAYYLIIVALLGVLVFSTGIGMDIMGKVQNMSDLQNAEELVELFSEMFLSPTFIILGLIYTIITIMLSAWMYTYAFKLGELEMKDRPYTFSSVLKASYSKVIGRFILSSILAYTALIIMAAVISGIAGLLHWSLGVIGFVALIGIAYRWLIVPAAIALDDKGVMEAFTLSMKKISFGKAYVYFGISVLVIIALFILIVILSVIPAILGSLSEIGIVLQYIINALSGGVITMLTVSIIIGLHMRLSEPYSEDEGTPNIEDHLIE